MHWVKDVKMPLTPRLQSSARHTDSMSFSEHFPHEDRGPSEKFAVIVYLSITSHPSPLLTIWGHWRFLSFQTQGLPCSWRLLSATCLALGTRLHGGGSFKMVLSHQDGGIFVSSLILTPVEICPNSGSVPVFLTFFLLI